NLSKTTTPNMLLLLLALSLGSLAPVASLPAACPLLVPSSFTISRFSTFTPSGTNPIPAQISFSYSDDAGLASSTCLLRGATETSGGPVVCANPDISFEPETTEEEKRREMRKERRSRINADPSPPTAPPRLSKERSTSALTATQAQPGCRLVLGPRARRLPSRLEAA
ncbi:hypothetical protein BUE80_DR004424, partial [Diplocarpon rosae]